MLSPGAGSGINDPAGAETVEWFQSGVGASGPLTSGLYVSNAAGVVDLNSELATPGWTIQKATGINDKGQSAASAHMRHRAPTGRSC